MQCFGHCQSAKAIIRCKLTPLQLVHTADTDKTLKTRLSCLVRVGGVNTIIGDKTKLSCIVSTQFPISKFSVVFNRLYLKLNSRKLKTGSR